MAIIIPSENIYKRENQKVIDNAIANVYLQENIYNVNIIQMFSMDNAIGSSTKSQEKTFIGDWGTGGEGKRIRFELECVYDEYSFIGTSSDTIRNDEIKLLTHITTQGNESAENFYDYEYLAKQQTFVYEMEDIPLPIPASNDFSEIGEFVNEKIKDNIFYSLEILSGSVEASITISFLKSVTVYLAEEYLLNGEWYGYTRNTIGVSPTITTLELSLYLNYSKVNSTARTIGKSGLSYQLNKNELLQKDTIYNEKPISGYIAEQILTSYKNGKETATLICSISDYYDENGEKVISIDGVTNILLPKEYQEVEYIESTGTQYIDIGETINTDTDTVELIFQVTEQNMYKWVFGEHDNNARFGLGSGDGVNKRNVAYGDSTYKVSDTQFYNYKHTFVSDKNGIMLDNTKIVNFKSFASTSTLYIFNLNLNGANYCAGAKVWGYKQTRNGKLLRNFIPCYRISDGVVGLYELVDNKFYESKGSGEFLKGKSILGETKMSFRMYDEVIPMVYTADGIDTPMSKRKDGSTKSFIVVGSKIYYDGAVWQELYLQEA